MERFKIEEGVSIIGGDLRNIKLSQYLCDNCKAVYTYGINEWIENSNNIKNKNDLSIYNEKNNTQSAEGIINCLSIKEAIEKSKIIVTPIPISKDNMYINAPFCNEKIETKELFEKLLKNITQEKLIITGKIQEDICLKYNIDINGMNTDYYKNKNENRIIINIQNREDFAIFNAIATVEGAIAKMIEQTKITLYGSNILIIGFGRIGKILEEYLQTFNANIYCTARRLDDLTWIEAKGSIPVRYSELNEVLSKMDIIVNTVPRIILDRTNIKRIKKESYLLDLASSPGGFDEKIIQEFEFIKYEKYLGIPGKIAPIESAKIIRKVINNIIDEIN